MARTFYSVVLCLTLAMLAIMWLSPGTAQNIIDLATGVVRAQSPDYRAAPAPNSPPQALPYGNLPYDSHGGPPAQPQPVSRPVGWPGTPVDQTGGTNGYPATANPTPTSLPPAAAGSGVTVWDPNGNYRATSPATTAPLAGAPAPAVAQGVQPYGQSYSQTPAPGVASPTAAAQQSPYQQQPAVQQQLVQQQPYGAAPQYGNALPPEAGLPVNNPQYIATANPLAAPLPGLPAQPNTAATNVQVLPGPPQEMPDANIYAKVGTESILKSDVIAMTYDFMQQKKMEVPPAQLAEFMAMAERPLLKQLVELKLVYNDALHNIPAAGLGKVQSSINDSFDKEQMPKLLKTNNVTTKQELEVKLRERGSSLDYERRAFLERMLFQGWMAEKVKQNTDIPLADILGVYEQNIATYEYPATARWEELMVAFNRFPDKAAAEAAIIEMGNAVMLQGAPFAEVAKARSHGPTAANGGSYDWTTKGSLSSKEVDFNVFSLPVGRLSQIVTSDRGLHIIRVVERKEAGRKSFADAQGDIKKKLKDDLREKQVNKYLDELRMKTPVWTIYDDKPGGLKGLPAPARTESNF